MAASRKKRDADSKAWLLGSSGNGEGRAGTSSPGAETRQWLAVPSPTKSRPENGHATGSAPSETEIEHRPAAPRKRPPKRVKQRQSLGTLFSRPPQRRLEAKLRQAEERVEAQQREIEEMRDYIERLEGKLRRRAARAARAKRTTRTRSSGSAKAAAGDSKRASSAPSTTARTRRSTGSKRRVNLNDATFEELRAAGLSVTQSARLIAYRDARGPYESLGNLDSIPGLSADTLTDLKAQVGL